MSKLYNLYLRAPDFTRIGEIDKYTNLEMRLIHASVSRWMLDIPADSDIVSEIAYGRGLIIERNGRIVISGPIDHIEQEWVENVNVMRLSGPDDTIYLADSLAYPVVTDMPDYTTQAYDIRTGVASTVMREYVDWNIGPKAISERQILGVVLEITDPLVGVGALVTGRARFDSLLELLQSLAISGGDLGFRLVQSETALQLIFEIYQPVDRTSTVIFSPGLQNLRAFRYSTDASDGNYIIVGGGGEGTERVFYEAGDAASITMLNRRIERFRDRRDTIVIDELAQSAQEELIQRASKSSLSISPIDTESLSFMTHYFLGDRVTVVANAALIGAAVPPAITIQDVIREIRITVTPDKGETIEPSVGTLESGRQDIFSVFSRLDNGESRISNLERR